MSNGCAGGVGELRGAGRKQKVFVRSLRLHTLTSPTVGPRSPTETRSGRLPVLLTSLPSGPSAECRFVAGTRAARCQMLRDWSSPAGVASYLETTAQIRFSQKLISR